MFNTFNKRNFNFCHLKDYLSAISLRFSKSLRYHRIPSVLYFPEQWAFALACLSTTYTTKLIARQQVRVLLSLGNFKSFYFLFSNFKVIIILQTFIAFALRLVFKSQIPVRDHSMIIYDTTRIVGTWQILLLIGY